MNLQPFCALVVAGLIPLAPAQAQQSKHPCLLVDRADVDRIKEKIRTYPWAKRLWEQVKGHADRAAAEPGYLGTTSIKEIGLAYAITGDAKYRKPIRDYLLRLCRAPADRISWQWGPRPVDAVILYDLAYDLFSGQEHGRIQGYFRGQAEAEIEQRKDKSPTPNMSDHAHMSVGLIGFCLGDDKLIDWALNHNPPGPEFGGPGGPRRGGFKLMLEHHVKDGLFFNEATWNYACGSLSYLITLAEAAHHNGVDLYQWKSPGGHRLKEIVDGYLRIAFPLESTGVGKGSLRVATVGDGGTTSPVSDGFLANPPFSRLDRRGLAARGFRSMAALLEVAYKRYRDPKYAWVISLNPERDDYWYPLGFSAALTHGEPLPEKLAAPSAPSGVYKGICMAMLRADESPGYWSGGGLAAVMKLPRFNVHGHKDHYQIILHGYGRLLYPDRWSGMYETREQSFTRYGCGHNTVSIDGKSIGPIGNGVEMNVRQDLDEAVKFVAVTGVPWDRRDFEVGRAVFLTREYLGDLFWVNSKRSDPSDYDWFLHGFGALTVDPGDGFEPSRDLLAPYRHIKQERKRSVGSTWSAQWEQRDLGIARESVRLGEGWFKQSVGVRMTMLGKPDTTVYRGLGPYAKPPDSCPLLCVRRRARATVFAALHEPFMSAPKVRPAAIMAVERLTGPRAEKDPSAAGMRLEAPAFADYLMVDFSGQPRTVLLRGETDEREQIRFKSFAYIRRGKDRVTARGGIEALSLKLPPGARPESLRINGKEAAFEIKGAYVRYTK